MRDWQDPPDVVAVLVETGGAPGSGSERRLLPISEATADAINAGRVASFNLFSSLALREQLVLERLFRLRERVARMPRRDPDFGTSYQITVASTAEVDR